MIQWRILKNSGFSFRDSGVGGFVVDVPIASEGVGGVFGRKERMYDFDVAEGLSCMYCPFWSAVIALHVRTCYLFEIAYNVLVAG